MDTTARAPAPVTPHTAAADLLAVADAFVARTAAALDQAHRDHPDTIVDGVLEAVQNSALIHDPDVAYRLFESLPPAVRKEVFVELDADDQLRELDSLDQVPMLAAMTYLELRIHRTLEHLALPAAPASGNPRSDITAAA